MSAVIAQELLFFFNLMRIVFNFFTTLTEDLRVGTRVIWMLKNKITMAYVQFSTQECEDLPDSSGHGEELQ